MFGIDRNICTGCTACAAMCPTGCIEMVPDENGFYYPKADSAVCISCGACDRVCPAVGRAEPVDSEREVWGAYSLDGVERAKSSSGGVFSLLARCVFEKDGVVYGAAYGEDYRVCHIGVADAKGLSRLRGAKYSQSFLGDTFGCVKADLDAGKPVLFSGTPCQVAGLRSYLGREYSKLITVDLVCHGVSSPMAWKEYIKYRAKTDANGALPERINQRSKHTGWSKYRYSGLFEYPKGERYSSLSGDDLFMKLFVCDHINRISCGDCHFKGFDRCSDITLGDLWGVWDFDPEMDDDGGTSLVLVHSSVGLEAFDSIKSALRYKPVSEEMAAKYNPSLVVTSVAKEDRLTVLSMIRNGDIALTEKIFSGHSVISRIKRRIMGVFNK